MKKWQFEETKAYRAEHLQKVVKQQLQAAEMPKLEKLPTKAIRRAA